MYFQRADIPEFVLEIFQMDALAKDYTLGAPRRGREAGWIRSVVAKQDLAQIGRIDGPPEYWSQILAEFGADLEGAGGGRRSGPRLLEEGRA